MVVSRALQPLVKEQAYLIDRGVRCLALVAWLGNDSCADNLSDLCAGASDAAAIPFSLDPHIAGYASHAWVIDLLRWAKDAPTVQRNRIFGLLLGYSSDAIERHEEKIATLGLPLKEESMEPFDAARTCPQQCGGSKVKNVYHASMMTGTTMGNGCWKEDWAIPHMHRTCETCEYDWAETPLT